MAEGNENINTPDYWDRVYRQEWEAGLVSSDRYSRDYGPIHDVVISLVPAGSSVLDVACGTGLLCQKIGRRVPGARVTGVDFSAYTIAQNRERDAALGVEYLRNDIRSELPSLGRQFDVVTMCEIIEHLDKPEKVLADAMGLVRPGGRFILTCPHDDQIPDPEHVRHWGHDQLFHVLSPYSNTISFMHFPPPYYHIWMLAYLTKR
jgi:2-polyprenyl-3-methyl-5-hydroxy-6-metoxy-1,4-benzoquinol methylase